AAIPRSRRQPLDKKTPTAKKLDTPTLTTTPSARRRHLPGLHRIPIVQLGRKVANFFHRGEQLVELVYENVPDKQIRQNGAQVSVGANEIGEAEIRVVEGVDDLPHPLDRDAEVASVPGELSGGVIA